MSNVIINGQLISSEFAKISITDRGLLLGEGLFETFKIENRILHNIDLHWQRLVNSASFLGLDLPLTINEFAKKTAELLSVDDLINVGLRLTVTSGCGGRGLVSAESAACTYLIQHFPLPLVPLSYNLTISSFKTITNDPLSQIKSLSYIRPILIKKEALSRGKDDGLVLTFDNYISETSSANFYLIKNNRLYTPPLSDGALPGTIRKKLLNSAHTKNIEVIEERINYAQLVNADGALISNSLLGIVNVSSIDNILYNDLSIHSFIEKINKIVF